MRGGQGWDGMAWHATDNWIKRERESAGVCRKSTVTCQGPDERLFLNEWIVAAGTGLASVCVCVGLCSAPVFAAAPLPSGIPENLPFRSIGHLQADSSPAFQLSLPFFLTFFSLSLSLSPLVLVILAFLSPSFAQPCPTMSFLLLSLTPSLRSLLLVSCRAKEEGLRQVKV